VDAVIDAAAEAGIAIRIGVNAGSLDKSIEEREGLSLPDKLVLSAVSFVSILKRGDLATSSFLPRCTEPKTLLRPIVDSLANCRQYRCISESLRQARDAKGPSRALLL
jgi:4-hydroxy-3-methylbut-2-en-1-yl diphosphate synthase IspG/GcpE